MIPVMTMKEHKNFVHLCGRTGIETEVMYAFCKTTCPILRDCLLNHCVKPADQLSQKRFEWTVDRLIEFYRGKNNKGGKEKK